MGITNRSYSSSNKELGAAHLVNKNEGTERTITSTLVSGVINPNGIPIGKNYMYVERVETIDQTTGEVTTEYVLCKTLTEGKKYKAWKEDPSHYSIKALATLVSKEEMEEGAILANCDEYTNYYGASSLTFK